jgi:ubiquinone/menaquinone biosynthesis C-methylase UbiE
MSDGAAKTESPEELQQRYYRETSAAYDGAHVTHAGEQEHSIALAAMSGLMDHFAIRSLLDVGSGTGRVLRHFLACGRPFDRLLGVEPVAELRQVGHARGIPPGQLIEGDALKLPFADGEFDLVCAFGILHHIREPNRAIREMFRVARKGVFFSDMNNFGCGSPVSRIVKRAIRALGLWPLTQFIATRGKGYKFSEGDGVHYSYSLYDSLAVIREFCREPILVTTKGFGVNPFHDCSHVAFYAAKEQARIKTGRHSASG